MSERIDPVLTGSRSSAVAQRVPTQLAQALAAGHWPSRPAMTWRTDEDRCGCPGEPCRKLAAQGLWVGRGNSLRGSMAGWLSRPYWRQSDLM